MSNARSPIAAASAEDGAPRAGSRVWLMLGGWALVISALALLGGGISSRLSPVSLFVPGTPSARAHEMLDRQFGNSVPVTVLLQGPAGAIDRQGPRLVAALRRQGKVEVMSPWNSNAELATLRPKPTTALVVANFIRPESEAMSEVVPAAQRITRETVGPPVRAHVGGVAAIGVAIQDEALAATHSAEILVTPILVIVLLLVFRSPIAAAVPLLMGAATVLGGRGLLVLATSVIPINSIAVAIASMMGLALGVDYALLMVSRLRQERDAGADQGTALAIASQAAGRTIVFAGATLIIAMFTAAMVAPGELLASVAAGVIISGFLGVLLAVSLMPALLQVLGPHLERWRVPSPARGGRLLALAGGLIARPWIAIPLIVAPMLAIAAPANALSMGPPDPRQLPPSNATRQGFEALQKAIGPGWAAPIMVVATARDGVITRPDRLRAISRWQDRIAREPDVSAVIGPASLQKAEGPLATVHRAYDSAPERLASAQGGIASLRAGLRRASKGVVRLRDGLDAAATGAATISGRTRHAQAGAARLEGGLARASAGARRLSGGLDRAVSGAERLLRGQRRLSRGAEQLARGIGTLDDSLRGPLEQMGVISTQLHAWAAWIRSLRVPTEMAVERLDRALQELGGMTVGKSDPRYAALVKEIREASALVGTPAGTTPPESAAALPAGVSQSLAGALGEIQQQLATSVESLASLPDQLDRLAKGVGRLRVGANRVAAGAQASERGTRQLRASLQRLAHGGQRLDHGVGGARSGAARLAGGLGSIASGADRLSGALRGGNARSGKLAGGLAKPQGPLSHYAVLLRSYQRGYHTLRARSPGALDSGYLMLTALDGTVPATREQIAQVVNVDGGGQSARMLVVPASGPSTEPTLRLTHRLQGELPSLARTSATDVAIGEGAQSLADYTDATMARLPWLVISLALVATLTLILVVRSLLLPVVAVALNLLTIAAAFGALELLFGFDVLVGPHYVDAVSAAGILTIMFVLSIDYEVFLLTRMREAWLQTHDHIYAIEHGLRHTAGVITGAATIMSAVFLAFATAQIASLQQFGAGLTIAVVLDATVIRLVLLPAIMRALGPRAWWLPGWLDRRLPNIDHGGGPALAGLARDSAPPPASVPAAAVAVEADPVAELGAVAHAEHRHLLDLLTEIETASEQGEAGRVVDLVHELRALAEPHFRYEQRALFPQLIGALGQDYVEGLYADQESVVETLARIEAIAEPGEIRESGAAETLRLVRAARVSVVSCDALAEVVERQPADVAERVLAVRERELVGQT
ncbi:MAG TPA: MMPL family transporter [Solirubrobacterales bacterium]|nr:MMPL family transporter [Solirubrobacterales bacterium]